MKFRIENVYRWVLLASLASSLMKTAFLCTMYHFHWSNYFNTSLKIANRLLVLFEGDYIVIAR